ncbi:MAG TPA: hypothetical protein VMW08_18530 [Acidimicrobiales bacterium]|nr:hypothetical protein [Acidimicrobiales bacterium]
MSETVLFGIGSAVFAVTVWGSVMAGGLWFRQLQDAEAQAAESHEPDEPGAGI